MAKDHCLHRGILFMFVEHCKAVVAKRTGSKFKWTLDSTREKSNASGAFKWSQPAARTHPPRWLHSNKCWGIPCLSTRAIGCTFQSFYCPAKNSHSGQPLPNFDPSQEVTAPNQVDCAAQAQEDFAKVQQLTLPAIDCRPVLEYES
mmetsp:Transcript_5704/g.12532  ORF Transcript_5704/g.12532 Transcript_5704/m.12532 type:complete len:146 (+) Transcript_5704:28-465(+)